MNPIQAQPQATPTLTANRAKLWVGDEDTYRQALRLIDGATTSVRFETFNFNAEQGRGLAEAFIRARARGVNVQIVLDSKSMRLENQRELADMMLKAGVDVRIFDPRSFPKPIISIDHAKILSVDGTVALVGGTNFDRHVDFDLNFELEGPAVPVIEDKFVQSWGNSKPAGPVEARPELPPVKPVPPAQGKPVMGADTFVRVTETAPKVGPRVAPQTVDEIHSAIRKAEKSIDLMMYILDDADTLAALKKAKDRGVDVRVLLNPPDAHKASLSKLNYAGLEELQKAEIPVRVFKVSPEYYDMHAKVAIFDGQEVLGGSTNWMKGAMHDFNEVGVWVKGPITDEVQQVFERAWKEQSSNVPPMSIKDKAKAKLMKVIAKLI